MSEVCRYSGSIGLYSRDVNSIEHNATDFPTATYIETVEMVNLDGEKIKRYTIHGITGGTPVGAGFIDFPISTIFHDETNGTGLAYRKTSIAGTDTWAAIHA